uniref:Uncharacterized protein n=1 Tax=Rhizophora mucronata TaxID=61149 RepID=A0A2P2QRZ7_RHIMU
MELHQCMVFEVLKY